MAFAVAVASLPVGIVWFETGAGNLAPAVGATAHIYQWVDPPATPSTPVTIYSDAALTAPMSQPITAGTDGSFPGYLADGQVIALVATYSGITLSPAMANVVRADHTSTGTGGGTAFAETGPNGVPFTLYVNRSTGSDSNAGDSPGKALATIPKAVSLYNTAGHGGDIFVSGDGVGAYPIGAPLHLYLPIRIYGESSKAIELDRTFGTPGSRSVWDAVTTAAGTTVTSSTASFVSGDINKIVSIYGAGLNGGTYFGFITSVPSGTVANLDQPTTIARNATTDPVGVKMSIVGTWNRTVTDASVPFGSPDVSSNTANFTLADIGTELVIAGAGHGGQALRSVINGIISSSMCQIQGFAATAVTGARCAIGVNFGNLITFHQTGCDLRRMTLADRTTGNNSIGAAIGVYCDDGTSIGVSQCVLDDVEVTSSDAAGAWEHIFDVDGSWRQFSGVGARRFAMKACRFFGARKVGETIRLNTANHFFFIGGGIVGSAPTSSVPQGIMVLDPQQTAGFAGTNATTDVHFTGFEGQDADFYSEGRYISYSGGRLGYGGVQPAGRVSFQLAAASYDNYIDTCATDSRVGSISDLGTNNGVFNQFVTSLTIGQVEATALVQSDTLTVVPTTTLHKGLVTQGKGTGVAGVQVRDDYGGNHQVLALRNVAASPNYAGEVRFSGTNGPGASGEAWGMGIDSAASTPFRDIAIFKVESSSVVHDVLYMAHNGVGNDVTFGFGESSPSNTHRIEVRGATVNTAAGGPPGLGLGTLRLWGESGQTGRVLSLYSNTLGDDQIYVDPTNTATWASHYRGDSTTSNPVIVIEDRVGPAFTEQLRLTANGQIELQADSNARVYRSAAGIVQVPNTFCASGFLGVGPGLSAGTTPTQTVDISQSGSTNASLALRTASWGHLQMLAAGSSPGDCTITTTNGTALRFGTNTSTSATTIRIDTTGDVVVGPGAQSTATELAASATTQLFWIPTTNGTPTGVPTGKTGSMPMLYDRSNNQLCIYNGGWKKVTLA